VSFRLRHNQPLGIIESSELMGTSKNRFILNKEAPNPVNSLGVLNKDELIEVPLCAVQLMVRKPLRIVPKAV
jgi:hypothetical protein